MKKTLLLIALACPIITLGQEKDAQYFDPFDVGWSISTPDPTLQATQRFMESEVADSIASVIFMPSGGDFQTTWYLMVKNKSQQPINIKWAKSQLDGSRIVLGEQRVFQISQSVPDDIVYPGDILSKDISNIKIIDSHLRLFNLEAAKKAYKKTGQPQSRSFKLVICVEYMGAERIYQAIITGVYSGKRKK